MGLSAAAGRSTLAACPLPRAAGAGRGTNLGARLLFIGDIHLGRRPSRLPEDLEAQQLRAAELGPAAAWRSCVDWACRERVDAVVLAGDVVDGLDDRFEAYSHLKAGVEQLIKAGVATLAVAGNHDVEALPRLADQIPGFVLLGRGGCWQEHRLAPSTGVRLLGWSFAKQSVRESPLASLQWRAEPGLATLGVLHCDVDASGSDYAPVRRRELEQVPVDAWLLGHVHKPGDLRAERPIGYLGSVVGLDPGEPGAHGPWLVEVEGPGRVKAQQIPLAPLRWEPIELSLTELDSAAEQGLADAAEGGLADAAEGGIAYAAEGGLAYAAEGGLADALHAALRRRVEVLHKAIAAGLAGAASGPRLVGCRLTLRGRSRHHRALRQLLATLHFEVPVAGVLYFIEKVEDEGAPDLDLAALAAGSDPLALLARRLQQLATGGGPDAALLREARARLAVRCSETRFSDPGVDLRDDEALRDLLRRAGTKQLEELLAQRERHAVERAGDAA